MERLSELVCTYPCHLVQLMRSWDLFVDTGAFLSAAAHILRLARQARLEIPFDAVAGSFPML